jgi:rhamnulokinase
MELFAAVDLGASSGRVAVGRLDSGKIAMQEVHRFKHEAKILADGSFRWEWDHIVSEVLAGLNKACELGEVKSIGVDSWAVDYGLLDSQGELIETPFAYRDKRTDGLMDRLKQELGLEYIYGRTGIQFIFFNTAYQLFAAKATGEMAKAKEFLLLPDLLNYLLCGVKSAEVTNASTTQLINAQSQDWDFELIEKLGIPRNIFPPVHKPGKVLGKVKGHGVIDGAQVVAVGSHDTASAVAGTPLFGKSAYISSGTWSLVGLDLAKPVTDQKAMNYNITNEIGAEGRIRFIRNVTGMWLLEESIRHWRDQGQSYTAAQLAAEAASLPSRDTFDTNDPIFEKPLDMPGRITKYLADRNKYVPTTPGEFARCIFDSLAAAYSRTLNELQDAAQIEVDTINIVGGGSANDLLNQLTADATGKRVLSGPIEATVLGNLIIQMQAAGVIKSLDEGRKLIAASIEQKEYLPTSGKVSK